MAADLDAVSGQLAAHYERAGWGERAIDFYARAAEVAQRVYANERAIDLFSKALELLDAEPAHASATSVSWRCGPRSERRSSRSRATARRRSTT